MTVDVSLPARRTRPRRPRPQSHALRSLRTAELLAAAARAPAARRDEILDEIIVVNRVVASSVAARYRGRGVEQDDLVQVALEGLTKAVHRFDLSSGNDLLTYAVPTIRGELQRYFRDLGWTVRPPRRIQELQRQVAVAAYDLTHRLGRAPSTAEVAEHLGITTEEHDAAMAAVGCFQPTSLDQPTGTDAHGVLGDLLVVLEPETGAAEARAVLGPVVRDLPLRDREILYLRYFEDLTQAEIGERLGVTQMQVSRLLARILGQLRARLEDVTVRAS